MTSAPKQGYREGSDQALTQSNALVGAMEQGGFLFSRLASRLEPWAGEMLFFYYYSRINNEALQSRNGSRKHGLHVCEVSGGLAGAEALTV